MPKECPFVSVVIPVYNDPDGLEMTLKSLKNQTYDPYEIIVVDNNSTDHTKERAEEIQKEYPELIRVEEERKIQSSYAARNKGIAASEGVTLAFIDADMTVDEDWIEKAVRSMDENNVQYLACDVQMYTLSKNTSFFFERYDMATAFPIEQYIERSNFGGAGNIFVRKEIFEKIGVFDERLISNGDVEFGNRLHESGVELYFDPDIVMNHPARTTFRSLAMKSFRVGRGAAQLREYHPSKSRSLLNPRQYLPPHPFLFRRRISVNIKLREAILFYCIKYLLKIIKASGMWYETLKTTWERHVEQI